MKSFITLGPGGIYEPEISTFFLESAVAQWQSA